METTASDITEESLETQCDCKSNISFEDALDIVLSTDDWFEYLDTDSVPTNTISDMITFQNSHELAYNLAFGLNTQAATALLEELLYYRSKKLI